MRVHRYEHRNHVVSVKDNDVPYALVPFTGKLLSASENNKGAINLVRNYKAPSNDKYITYRS